MATTRRSNRWLDLQHIIVTPCLYPASTGGLFLRKELNRSGCFAVALFCWCNGVEVDFVLEVLIFCGVNVTRKRE